MGTFKRFMLPMVMVALHVGAASSPVAGHTSVALADHVPTEVVGKSTFLDHLEADAPVALTFVLPLRNQQELQELLGRIYDPNDQQHYGQYLTTEEFIERFAPTQEDYDQVVAYAKSVGLDVHGTHPNRTLLDVHGAARTVESAFNLQLHRYALPSGRQFYAPDKNPEVPPHVASVISGVVGLHNHAKRHTYCHRKDVPRRPGEPSRYPISERGLRRSPKRFPSGPRGGFSPNDLAVAYNLSGVTAKGSDQAIALFELAGYQTSDITAYAKYFGLPTPQLKNIIVDGGSSDQSNAEVVLDIELALALAPNSVIYVYEGPNSGQGVLDTYNRIATDNLAKQVSSSWGMGEDVSDPQSLQAESAIFQQMAAQGQTVYAAAGDSGAYDDYSNNSSKTLVVDDPASQPYVVGVGGTTLRVNTATGAYQTESVWDDGLGQGAGGGGVSTVWSIPSWQANVSTVFSKTHRNVPDVALNADTDTGYAIYFEGGWQIYGGTSCAAPLWAAFTACVNQELAAQKQSALGFANPKLYAIGSSQAYTTNFHDVTTGNNLYYKAAVGYDNASGWGSFNGTNLYTTLTTLSTPTPPVPTSSAFGLLLKHTAPFAKGEAGSYHIVVSNTGADAASVPVTVAVSLPAGLTYSSFSGAGWAFDASTCSFTQNTPLGAGSSYPTIVLNVEVAEMSPTTVTPVALLSVDGTVSGTASDRTTVR